MSAVGQLLTFEGVMELVCFVPQADVRMQLVGGLIKCSKVCPQRVSN